MTTDFIVSLGIPTYKRPHRLRNLLERLHTQLAEDPKHFEVVVSDNCSQDETPDVVKEFTGKLHIKHYTNPTNIGANNNVLSLIEKSSGEYLWIVPDDDDFVYDDSLQQVYQAIANCDIKPAVVLVNYNLVELDTNKVLKTNAMKIDHDMFFEKGFDALTVLQDVDFLTGICLLVNREMCKHPFAREEAGEYHSPLSMALTCMAEGPCLVIAKPLVILGAGDTSNWRNYWPRIYFQDMTSCLYAAHQKLGLPAEILKRQIDLKRSYKTASTVLSWHRFLFQKYGMSWKKLAQFYGYAFVLNLILIAPFKIFGDLKIVKKLRGKN